MVFSLPRILPLTKEPERRFLRYLNFLFSLMARREREIHVASLPFELTLDLSTRCQLSCPYCSVGNRTIRRTPGLMPRDLHNRILEDLGQTAFLIWYFSTGEPLLNKNAAKMFRKAAQEEIFSVVSTNLSFALSSDQIDELITSGLGVICVSLDGATPDSYNRYRVKGNFDLVLKNLKNLVDRKKELGKEYPIIEWRFLVFEHNQDQIEEAGLMAREIGVDILEFFPGSVPPDTGENSVRACSPNLPIPLPSGPALKKADNRSDTFFRRSVSMESPPEPPIPDEMRERKCDWLYFGSAFFPNGSVGPCCASNHEDDDFGRLDESVCFDQTWNNHLFKQARQWFSAGKQSNTVCTRCPVPAAKDYQFRMTLRALVQNAPDWVIWILSKASYRFFWEIDALLSPLEARFIAQPPEGLDPDVSDAVHRLKNWKAPDSALDEKARVILDLLKTIHGRQVVD